LHEFTLLLAWLQLKGSATLQIKRFSVLESGSWFEEKKIVENEWPVVGIAFVQIAVFTSHVIHIG
jgi:hypothetical protein